MNTTMYLYCKTDCVDVLALDIILQNIAQIVNVTEKNCKQIMNKNSSVLLFVYAGTSRCVSSPPLLFCQKNQTTDLADGLKRLQT